MQRVSANWSIGDKITADRLQQVNQDLDTLFSELSNEDLSTNYNNLGYLTQVVDNENGITVNLDRGHIGDTLPYFTIQKVGDPKKYTVSYDANGVLVGVLYA